MRLLYLAPLDLSLDLGHAVHARRLVEALEARGHRLRVLALAPARPLEWPGARPAFVRRPAVPRLGFLHSEWMTARALRRECRGFRPDLLLVRQELMTFAPLLRRAPVPLVVESNCFLGGLARALGGWRTQVAPRLEGALLRRADRVGAVSEALRDLLLGAYGLDRVDVVPNGTWLPPLSSPGEIDAVRSAQGTGEKTFVALFAGNLNPLQGLPMLFQAVSRLASLPLVLWIAGEGTETEALRRRAQDLGDRVRFLGALSEPELARHAQAAQALLAPYRAGDVAALGLDPLKVLQALAADRPLLTGAPLDGFPGELFSGPHPSCRRLAPGDPQAWADAIAERVHAWVEAGRLRAGWPWPAGCGRGRRFITGARTWDHTARRWEGVFERALGRDRRRPAAVSRGARGRTAR